MDAGYLEDRDTSFAQSISKSMEMSYLLMSRSPWISVETHGGPAILEQRERSISHASMPSALELPGSQSPLRRSVVPVVSTTDDGYLDSQFDADASWLLKGQGESQQSVISLRSQSSFKAFAEPELSNLAQSVFNATNLLMGVGLLRHVQARDLCDPLLLHSHSLHINPCYPRSIACLVGDNANPLLPHIPIHAAVRCPPSARALVP